MLQADSRRGRSPQVDSSIEGRSPQVDSLVDSERDWMLQVDSERDRMLQVDSIVDVNFDHLFIPVKC